MNKKYTWISLVVFIAIWLAIELASAWWTHQSVNSWYPSLKKPFWTPPSWVFAPIWTVLYVMIATSGWLIYQEDFSSNRTRALIFYGIQLLFNLLWSFVFFAMHHPLLGLIDIGALLVMIVFTIIFAWPVNRAASFFLLPYLIWVIYATTLNVGIWILNSGR